MSHYAAGAAFERKVRDKLYADGAKLVVRSAGSKGPVDLVAHYSQETSYPVGAITTDPNVGVIRYVEKTPRRPAFVQVKRGRAMTVAKREVLCQLADDCGARAVLAYPEKVGRRIEVRLEVL